MTTKGRVTRCLPGPAVAVSIETFTNVEFQSTLATTIVRLSRQAAAEMKSKAKKAQQQHIENRQTTDPMLVTKFLMTFLEASGKVEQVSQIQKNIRDDVLWSTGVLPWRRSPLWLLAKVAIQLCLLRSACRDSCYKEFLVFFMSQVLDRAREKKVASDILHCMVSKISRRLLKMGPSTDNSGWRRIVEDSLLKTTKHMEHIWKMICKNSDPVIDLSPLEGLHPVDDAVVPLPAVEAHLDSLKTPSGDNIPRVFSPKPTVAYYSPGALPELKSGFYTAQNDSGFSLSAFECWVATELGSWLKANMSASDTCSKLLSTMTDYHLYACQQYGSNPEGLSQMVLICLELFVACDRAATHQHPILMDYDPAIPHRLLESLLLPLRSELERLFCVESYLKTRRSRAKFGYGSVLANFRSSTSFPVRFYEQSPDHQKLRDRIEEHARSERNKKKIEFADKKNQYNTLMEFYNLSSCEYKLVEDSDGDKIRVHDNSGCKKCTYYNRARSMTIDMDEWPLPSDELAARTVIFELDCPKAICDWRTATLFTILDILKSQYKKQETAVSNYGPDHCLAQFRVLPSQRLKLRSTTKPHNVTHRRYIEVGIATEADVCVNNGLSYHYYDGKLGQLVGSMVETTEIPTACMYTLQNAPKLQDFLFRPPSRPHGPEPNLVISGQHNCPDNMSLAEFRSLFSIPLGTHVQWSNILVQLFAPTIDFKKVDTNLVLLQAIRQAGPSSETTIRKGYVELCRDQFCHRLLQGLAESLNRIKENWESCQALQSFVQITTRIVELTESDDVAQTCFRYLGDCRHTADKWARRIRGKAAQSTDETQRVEFLRRAYEISQICGWTFDVDSNHLRSILSNSADAAILIKCALMIQETSRTAFDPSCYVHKICSQRWSRLCARALPLLVKEVTQNNNECLDIAISTTWRDYNRGRDWEMSSNETPHWLVTATTSGVVSRSQPVHYNLLTGELLVNGLSLSRLPAVYENHPTYDILFGRMALEVIPSDVPGMQFSAMKPHHDYTLYFGLSKDKNLDVDANGKPTPDLLIRCIKENETMVLFPRRLLKDSFPHHFIHDYVHWYYPDTNVLEFRPISTPWISEKNRWVMSRLQRGWMLAKEDESVAHVNMTTPTGRKISRIFERVESNFFLHISWNHSEKHVQIDLPRTKLTFSIHMDSPKKVLSREYRGMYLDDNTYIGTFIGLKSKLVLTNQKEERLALIPDGQVNLSRPGLHVEIVIEMDASTRMLPFYIDKLLGRISDNGDMQSILTRCYLHAVTAHCLPDQLTQKTGTEESLEILGSAAIRSFERLRPEDISILQRIANISPHREYYPPNERSMQKISWSKSLSPLVQHGGLYKGAKAILDYASSLKFFCQSEGQPKSVKPFERGHEFLHERDLIRSAVFRRSRFGAEYYTTCRDVTLSPRPSSLTEDTKRRCNTTFKAASEIFVGQNLRDPQTPRLLATCVWEFLATNVNIKGPGNVLPTGVFGYKLKNIEHCRSTVAEYWCQIHKTLQVEDITLNRYRLMMFVASLAFAKDIHVHTLQLLVALINNKTMRQVEIPVACSFNLTQGRKLDHRKLKDIVEDCCVLFGESPESKLPKRTGETQQQYRTRQNNEYESNSNKAKNEFVNAIAQQWPCMEPRPIPGRNFGLYIHTFDAFEHIRPLFKTWWDNRQFYSYLERLEKELMEQSPNLQPSSSSSLGSRTLVSPKPRTQFAAFVADADLLRNHAPVVFPDKPDTVALLQGDLVKGNYNTNVEDLKAMVDRLESLAARRCEEEYVLNLKKSITCLVDQENSARGAVKAFCVREQVVHLQRDLKKYLSSVWGLLASAVGMNAREIVMTENKIQSTEQPTYIAYNSPQISPCFFLRQLCHKRWTTLSPEWKQAIVTYGIAITAFQQAERLLDVCGNPADLTRELGNPGHENWQPMDHPESLLIEIESGILIRDVQADIAAKMREPPNGVNSVMQLHMGEGKSSVIVPIVAAALADSTRLVRVVVAKPQLKQMHQMLVSKLGGMCDRQIYHMPFSRSLKVDEHEAKIIDKTYRECMEAGGILLVQPEHILSFKLMGIESVLSGRRNVADSLLETLHFFDNFSRDIVDESDENFSVKFELIYTMGAQQSIDLGPERWRLLQNVLFIVAKVAGSIQRESPLSMEIEQATPAGAFARVRLLTSEAHIRLQSHVADEICASGLPGFPISRQPENVRGAVRRYITEPLLTEAEIAEVESCTSFWTDAIKGPALLLRGLLAGGVLAFTLGSKRWRVNYGLDNARVPPTRLAVPYRAKDNPSLRSEFSHPDVVTTLTCLSYYYGGLEDADLFLAFEHLVKSDQAESEFSEWVRELPELPDSYRNLLGINLRDRIQCTKLVFPHFRRSRAAINYFLSKIVFAREMREFPHKLSASGWDLGQKKNQPTTGFSGTNDSQHLLPLDMHYRDQKRQAHTNALVLQYLLQPENMVQLLPARSKDVQQWSNAELFLRTITGVDADPESKASLAEVIIDVGSQILELNNLQVAERWLELTSSVSESRKEAVIFFDGSDELSVVDRKGHVEPLQTSPFSKHMDSCFVFLDEAHTRGTDLRLPAKYRAAVTLGANLTKDRLVQG
jgi:hypothetical protein